MATATSADIHHLRAAEGWLQLGNCEEALAELDNIAPLYRAHPDVLALRWEIYRRAKKWDYALAVAEGLAEAAPNDPRGWIKLCQTLYFTKKVQQAYDLATLKLRDFLSHWEFHYDIACYACLLGKRQEAEDFLKKAMELGDAKQVTLLARADKDLEALWMSLGSSPTE